MTPGEAIRSFCVECVGGLAHEVPTCGGNKCLNRDCDKNGACLFHPYRMGRGRPSVKLIRKFCLFCMGDQQVFVRECTEENCKLHPFRMGHNPNFSDETRQKRRLAFHERAEKRPAMQAFRP